jgi:methylmalonyl-CoA/ethylmalonyl-CoA epimerase
MSLDPADHAELAESLDASFDHFAIATRRIRDLVPLWRDTLGGRFRLGADNAEVGWRTVRLEFAGAMSVELIEPLAGSTFLDGFLARHPTGGLHHVTFLVEHVGQAFHRLESHGYEPFGVDEGWYQLFVHPKRANGVLVQLMARTGIHEIADMTIEDVFAGRGYRGTGLPSP